MNFWEIQNKKDQIAIIDQQNGLMMYADLHEKVTTMKRLLPVSSRKQLGLILCRNEVYPLIVYLAALQKQDAVMLLDEKLNDSLLKNIIDTYKPDWIFTVDKGIDLENEYLCSEQDSFRIWVRTSSEESVSIYPDLAILLSTSGTTGSAKFVRLSYKNIQSNAKSITQYLDITANERGLANLPIHYSYGLSVINSHLYAGATILLTNESVLTKSFWDFMNSERASSFAGVPYTYQMLQRIGFQKMKLPHLRYFTQAGGRLNEKLVCFFGEYAKEHGKQFYVMYGQTEATARMSYLLPENILEKSGSIGKAIPDGKFSLDLETCELIYEGPNVMLGYATSLVDLSKGDEFHGRLHTGDLAEVDDEGFYYINGRMKRFIKLFGLRLNLDDIEKQIESTFHTNVVCVGTDDKMVVVMLNEEHKEEVQAFVEHLFKLHRSSFKIKEVADIPRLLNGKINYEALKDLVL